MSQNLNLAFLDTDIEEHSNLSWPVLAEVDSTADIIYSIIETWFNTNVKITDVDASKFWQLIKWEINSDGSVTPTWNIFLKLLEWFVQKRSTAKYMWKKELSLMAGEVGLVREINRINDLLLEHDLNYVIELENKRAYYLYHFKTVKHPVRRAAIERKNVKETWCKDPQARMAQRIRNAETTRKRREKEIRDATKEKEKERLLEQKNLERERNKNKKARELDDQRRARARELEQERERKKVTPQRYGRLIERKGDMRRYARVHKQWDKQYIMITIIDRAYKPVSSARIDISIIEFAMLWGEDWSKALSLGAYTPEAIMWYVAELSKKLEGKWLRLYQSNDSIWFWEIQSLPG